MRIGVAIFIIIFIQNWKGKDEFYELVLKVSGGLNESKCFLLA